MTITNPMLIRAKGGGGRQWGAIGAARGIWNKFDKSWNQVKLTDPGITEVVGNTELGEILWRREGVSLRKPV